MKRTTVMLPGELKRRAESRAKEAGQSFGEVVRESLEQYLRSENASQDPLLADDVAYEGTAPKDLARRHDRYLYDAE